MTALGRIVASSGWMAGINPLRYRGYYYDTETGFYYVQSRYYDPIVKRFISADTFASTGQDFLGYNMFAYCGNNSINCEDPTGELLYPGEIHNLVVRTYGDMYKLNEEQIILYNVNETGMWGRADLISNYGEVWEVKRAKTKYIEKGETQVAKYVRNTWKNKPDVKLKIGGEIPPLKPFPFSSGLKKYTVTAEYAGNGVIAYDYTTETDWETVGNIALIGLAMLGGTLLGCYTGGTTVGGLVNALNSLL